MQPRFSRSNSPRIGVVGGGASGFFAAIRIAESVPHARVTLLEKSNKFLGKVKVSGGGRCNVTHYAQYASQLLPQYPRGKSFLKKVFKHFDSQDTVTWFEQRGVKLKVEPDGRMFPTTNSSQTIIDCLLGEAQRLGVELKTSTPMKELVKIDDRFALTQGNGDVLSLDFVVIATGGHPKPEGYHFLKSIGHALIDPVPSLFTFNLPESPLEGLAGISVPAAVVKIPGTQLSYEGPLLVTHWGISGPAVLRTSAWGARFLAALQYSSTVVVQWDVNIGEEVCRTQLSKYIEQHPKRQVIKYPLFNLPKRLWIRLVTLAEIPHQKNWEEASKKERNRLVEWVVRAPLAMKGKTTFKEEFVTAGGVPLVEVNAQTLESRLCPGVFFAGEVLDIDGVTGGFNFQAAWSSGWLAGTSIVQQIVSSI